MSRVSKSDFKKRPPNPHVLSVVHTPFEDCLLRNDKLLSIEIVTIGNRKVSERRKLTGNPGEGILRSNPYASGRFVSQEIGIPNAKLYFKIELDVDYSGDVDLIYVITDGEVDGFWRWVDDDTEVVEWENQHTGSGGEGICNISKEVRVLLSRACRMWLHDASGPTECIYGTAEAWNNVSWDLAFFSDRETVTVYEERGYQEVKCLKMPKDWNGQ